MCPPDPMRSGQTGMFFFKAALFMNQNCDKYSQQGRDAAAPDGLDTVGGVL